MNIQNSWPQDKFNLQNVNNHAISGGYALAVKHTITLNFFLLVRNLSNDTNFREWAFDLSERTVTFLRYAKERP
jgi:hypothetical protein